MGGIYIVYIGYVHNLIVYHPCRTIHTDFYNSNMNVNKKLGKLIDAAQPEPPTVEKLMNALRTTTQAEERFISAQCGGGPHGRVATGARRDPGSALASFGLAILVIGPKL